MAAVAALLLLASRHLLTPYSYWGDEMFSVVESLAPSHEFLHRWILWDVHPPLYQLLLRGWMALFGSGEVATRSLSFLFVALALSLMARLTAGRPLLARLVAVGVLGSAPAFAYYGQETRSYGMVLALSTLVTLLCVRLREEAGAARPGERRLQALAALALSLTHYFGWIWTALLTLVQIVRPSCRAERRQALILLPLLFIWPLIHLGFGELLEKSGGNFWITISVPIVSTVNNAISGLLPGLEISRQPQRLLRWLLAGSALLALAWPLQTWSQTWHGASAPVRQALRRSRLLGALIVLFVALISLIDLRTPMSTARNFIVLLPALAVALAGLSEALAERLSGPRRLLLALLLLLALVLQLRSAALAVADKAFPRDNWKDLAAAVRQLDLCRNGCRADFIDSYWTYYFGGLDLRPLNGPAGAPDAPAEPLLLLRAASSGGAEGHSHICLRPRQRSLQPTVLVPRGMLREGEAAAAGLTACDDPQAQDPAS